MSLNWHSGRRPVIEGVEKENNIALGGVASDTITPTPPNVFSPGV